MYLDMVLIKMLLQLWSGHWLLTVFAESDVSPTVVYMHHKIDKWDVPLTAKNEVEHNKYGLRDEWTKWMNEWMNECVSEQNEWAVLHAKLGTELVLHDV